MTRKEIRIFLLAILAVAFVSLFTQIIAGISAAATLYKDIGLIRANYIGTVYYGQNYIDKSASYIVGITVVAFVFVAAFVFAMLFKKKKVVGFSVLTLVCVAAVVVFIVLVTELRATIPSYNEFYPDAFSNVNYELFQQFLTIGISNVVAMLLIWLAWFLLEFKEMFSRKEKDNSQIVQLAIENIKINQEDDEKEEQAESAIEITKKGWKNFFKRKK